MPFRQRFVWQRTRRVRNHCRVPGGAGSIRRFVAVLLVVAGVMPALASAQSVKVYDWVDADGDFVGVTSAEPSALAPPGRLAYQPARVRGARRVAVIPMQFDGGPAATWTTEGLQATVFTGAASVDAFIRESTYGRVWLVGRDSPSGDVYPTVAITATTTSCSEDAYADAALAALRAQGANLTGTGTDGYDHYVFVFPRVAACGWVGLGAVPGRRTWINGGPTRAVISHELGHNFGLAHANTLRCFDAASAPVSISDTCSSTEYGDPFETMGSQDKQLSGAARSLIGAFDNAEAVRVTGPGTIAIESVSTPGPAIRALEIARPGANQTWYVEARAVAGQFDDFASTDPVLQGVLIRRRANDTLTAAPTQLIDAHPATSSVADAAFLPGETFSDPAGLTIRVVARTATTATVAIAFGAGPAPPTPPPSTPIGGPPTGGPPGTSPPAAPPPRAPPAAPPAGAAGTARITNDLAVANRWPSRITVRRLSDGRVVVSSRVISRARRCTYGIRVGANTLVGRCTKLTGATGWRVTRTVRAAATVTVTMRSPTHAFVTRRVRVPKRPGVLIGYRL